MVYTVASTVRNSRANCGRNYKIKKYKFKGWKNCKIDFSNLFLLTAVIDIGYYKFVENVRICFYVVRRGYREKKQKNYNFCCNYWNFI